MTNPYREAKCHLSKNYSDMDRSRGVCPAINKAEFCEQISFNQCQLAVNVISSRLKGYLFVSGWLYETNPEYANFKRTIALENQIKYFDELQAYRHRWLDELADEWDRTKGKMDDPREFSS